MEERETEHNKERENPVGFKKVKQVVGNIYERLKTKIIKKNAQNIQKYYRVYSGNVSSYKREILN